jgi:hypothetical protein
MSHPYFKLRWLPVQFADQQSRLKGLLMSTAKAMWTGIPNICDQPSGDDTDYDYFAFAALATEGSKGWAGQSLPFSSFPPSLPFHSLPSASWRAIASLKNFLGLRMLVGTFYCIFRRKYQQKWAGHRYPRPTGAKKWAGRGPPGPIASAAYDLLIEVHQTPSQPKVSQFQKKQPTSVTLRCYVQYLEDKNKELSILNSYQMVKKVFVRYNAVLPSSAAVERLFSLAGLITILHRRSMSDKTFEHLLLLKGNK